VTELRIAVVPGEHRRRVIAEAVKALQAVADAGGRRIATTHFDWGAEKYLATGAPPSGGAGDAAAGLRRDPAWRDGATGKLTTGMRPTSCSGCGSGSTCT
jgi:hypothetical protein